MNILAPIRDRDLIFFGETLSKKEIPWIERSWPFDYPLTDFSLILYFSPEILPILSCQPTNFKTALEQPNFTCSLLLWYQIDENINYFRQLPFTAIIAKNCYLEFFGDMVRKSYLFITFLGLGQILFWPKTGYPAN